MEEKTHENNPISDTESPVFENFQESIAKSSENSINSEEASQNAVKNPQITENRGENEAKSLVSPQNSSDFFNDNSLASFSKDFPDVDPEKLKSQASLQEFLGIITKNPTLSEIYACFNRICAKAEENSQNKLLYALANAKASVGALSSAHERDNTFFTKEQVKQMSPAQIKENYKAIRESQQRW